MKKIFYSLLVVLLIISSISCRKHEDGEWYNPNARMVPQKIKYYMDGALFKTENYEYSKKDRFLSCSVEFESSDSIDFTKEYSYSNSYLVEEKCIFDDGSVLATQFVNQRNQNFVFNTFYDASGTIMRSNSSVTIKDEYSRPKEIITTFKDENGNIIRNTKTERIYDIYDLDSTHYYILENDTWNKVYSAYDYKDAYYVINPFMHVRIVDNINWNFIFSSFTIKMEEEEKEHEVVYDWEFNFWDQPEKIEFTHPLQGEMTIKYEYMEL